MDLVAKTYQYVFHITVVVKKLDIGTLPFSVTNRRQQSCNGRKSLLSQPASGVLNERLAFDLDRQIEVDRYRKTNSKIPTKASVYVVHTYDARCLKCHSSDVLHQLSAAVSTIFLLLTYSKDCFFSTKLFKTEALIFIHLKV